MSTTFEKVRRAYTGLSLLLLNTLFLLIIMYAVLEIAAGWLLKKYNSTVDTATVGVIDAGVTWPTKLPDRMVAIGDATAAGKDRAIELFAHTIVAEMVVGRLPLGPRVD